LRSRPVSAEISRNLLRNQPESSKLWPPPPPPLLVVVDRGFDCAEGAGVERTGVGFAFEAARCVLDVVVAEERDAAERDAAEAAAARAAAAL
jgi:hypothetical protein